MQPPGLGHALFQKRVEQTQLYERVYHRRRAGEQDRLHLVPHTLRRERGGERSLFLYRGKRFFFDREAEARGEAWISPEIRAAEAEAAYLRENELAFEVALKEKCAAKGLDFEKELADYRKAVAGKEAKTAEKKRLAEEKEKSKAEKAKARKEERLAALSPEDRLKKEQKEAKRAEAEEAAWQRELAAGEAYRAKVKAELEAKGV